MFFLSGAWSVFGTQLRRCPADLAAVFLVTLGTIMFVYLVQPADPFVRVLFGLVFVLFLPGYAFISALFPEAGPPPHGQDPEGTIPEHSRRRIDWIERVALSFGVSVAIVPLIGLTLDFTRWGIGFLPILVALSGFTVGASLIALVRRYRLPPDERFSVSYQQWLTSFRAHIRRDTDTIQLALNIVLVLSILLAASTVVYAVTTPPDGERYTEFAIVTEEDGEGVASEYPAEIFIGEGEELVVGIENAEQETVSYSVVIQLQRVDHTDDGLEVTERSNLDRFDVTLVDGEEWYHTHVINPDIVGEDLRLVYLLYDDEPPESPTRENAYRHLHIWIDVYESE